MDTFRNSELLELYGSTEQGWATLLRPSEQLTKLGSVGREFTGSGRIKLRDENEVADGGVGELYSRTPWCFQGYWNLPDKTARAFAGDKRPKSFSFIAEHDMPRTATGKILHRVLRSRF